jgi:Flp pilus assembly protein protease CpaA
MNYPKNIVITRSHRKSLLLVALTIYMLFLERDRQQLKGLATLRRTRSTRPGYRFGAAVGRGREGARNGRRKGTQWLVLDIAGE